jgi:L-lactate utilization protein LutB
LQKNIEIIFEKRLEKAKAALEKNRMEVHVVQTTAEVAPLVKEMLAPGCTISNGGSITLQECGVMELLRSGEYNFLDRDAPGVDNEVLFRQVFGADAYLCSANAVTMQGEVYEIDGRANRVAAIAYGPKSVIMVVGRNKLVETLDDARVRRAKIAAPANVLRVGAKTPCAVTGECSDCHSPGRICCTELVLYHQQMQNRIKIILVNEDLGY